MMSEQISAVADVPPTEIIEFNADKVDKPKQHAPANNEYANHSDGFGNILQYLH
ncbi:MAG: hypothetical protein GWO28_00525, partial [candidate division Zixibacteria bacterium]|nr:hypothetical protein [candidate division Zixibacteria bacterium]